MDVIKMHKITVDEGSNRERLLNLKKHMLSFFAQPNIHDGLIVMKHCLSLVNDVIEYSMPIKLDRDRFMQCKDWNVVRSYPQTTIERFKFDINEFELNGLFNDLTPRFYCKQWFNCVVTILEMEGLKLDEIEMEYHRLFDGIKQYTIFDF